METIGTLNGLQAMADGPKLLERPMVSSEFKFTVMLAMIQSHKYPFECFLSPRISKPSKPFTVNQEFLIFTTNQLPNFRLSRAACLSSETTLQPRLSYHRAHINVFISVSNFYMKVYKSQFEQK